MGDNAPRPELAKVLATLAQFSTPTGHVPTPERAQTSAPSTSPLASSSYIPDQQPQPAAPSRTSTPQGTPGTTTPPLPPSIDPSKIIDFSSATKYVMKTLSRNPESSSKIQRIIKNQHDNERTWWAGREAILTKHKERVQTRQEVNDVLRALGTLNTAAAGTATEAANPSAEDEKAEIQRYDAKVYSALRQMVKGIDGELSGLGVPFFAISHELVYEGVPAKKGTVSTEGLRGLQKKMLELLQDMFGD